MSTLQLEDGYVRFTIGGDSKEYAVDSMLAATVAEKLASQHGLTIQDGLYVYTDEFLSDLCETYAKRFDLPAITASVANRIWMAAQMDVHSLKKNMSGPPASPEPTESTPST